MSFNLNKLLRPHIQKLKPYSSARDEYAGREGIFLDANENPIGSTTEKPFNRYPDPGQEALKIKISSLKNVPRDQIFLGNGSDEAIDLLFRAFCRPGLDNVILLPPTYGMYEVSASINDIKTKKISLSTDFQIITQDVLNALDDHTKIIFICSPNNPSGNKMIRQDVLKIIKNFDGLVLVDEAYIDFCDEPSFTVELTHHPNLVVMQTFSKAWGLASLRLGMAFASKEIIHILNKIKPPYNISGLTQEKVLKALENTQKLESMVKTILEERAYLEIKLKNLALVKHVFSSDANFLLVKVKDARKTYEQLILRKIIVRDRSNVILCDDCLRITVGTRTENQQLLEVLAQLQIAT
ncbi:MAG: histidinol-phosphate transaminase [Cyclobacteriaceae bacterium]